MPPYDEQTQAFIDGEGQAREGGDPARFHASGDPYLRGPWASLASQDGLALALSKPREGHLGPGEAILAPMGPRGPPTSSGCCLFVPPRQEGWEPARSQESWPSFRRSGEPVLQGEVCPEAVEAWAVGPVA